MKMLRAVGGCLTCLIVLCGSVSRAGELDLVKEAQSKIESGSFSRQDATTCERYAKTSKTNQDRFLLLVASYQRRVLGYPSKSLEIEQYGPEWVLYRDAEVLRKEKNRFSSALSKYRELSVMAEGTMFGDAAGFGIISVFLSLADKDGVQAWAAEKAELEAALVRCRGMRRNLAIQAPSPCKLAQIDQDVGVTEQALKDLMALPTGRHQVGVGVFH